MLHRRQFLQSSAAIAASAALSYPAAAIPPIQRNGQPNFKFSLAAYSYRDCCSSQLVCKTTVDSHYAAP